MLDLLYSVQRLIHMTSFSLHGSELIVVNEPDLREERGTKTHEGGSPRRSKWSRRGRLSETQRPTKATFFSLFLLINDLHELFHALGADGDCQALLSGFSARASDGDAVGWMRNAHLCTIAEVPCILKLPISC